MSLSSSMEDVDEELVELLRLVIDCLSEPTVFAHLTWGEAGQTIISPICLDFPGDAIFLIVFNCVAAGKARDGLCVSGSNL